MKLKKLISTVLCLLVLFETQANVFAVNGTITYSPDGPNWTNSDVIVTLTGDYDAIDNNGGANTYTFSDNGSFLFDFSSGVSETGSVTATVNRIDKVAPTFFGVENGSIYTGTININFADANLSGATLNGNPYNSGDPISAIALYTFQVSDLAGNITGANFEITSPIDIIAPTASIEYTPAILTSGDVLAIITGFSEAITGLSATGNIFVNNGTFDFVYRDLAGNTGSTTATVNRIDKTTPTATIIYSITGDTNQDVSASITGFSENITGLNTTGTLFSSNGSFVFTYQDDAGNLGSTTATVSRIDKTPITASINYTPASLTNTDVIATIGGFNKTGITVIGGNTNTFTSNGSYIFNYQDLAGNTGSMTATVNRIDKQLPTFLGITNGTSYNTPVSITFADDNTGVTATINGSPYTNGGILSGRGSQTLIVTDAAGNTTGATFQLDTTTPTISLIGSGIVNLEVYNSYVELGAIWFDNNTTGSVSSIIGAVNTSLLGTYIHQYDYSDGQNTGSTTRTINICDGTLPIITLNGSGIITLERTSPYIEDGAIRSDNYDGTGTVSTILGSVDIQTIGTYILTYQKLDSSGNTGTATRTINVIDTVLPTASIIYSLTGPTNQDTIATITGFSETITNLNTNNYTFTGNGSFLFTYQDLAGNTGTTTATVTRIDKINPTGSIRYSPAGPTRTNGTVFAQITGFSETTTGLNATGYLFLTNGSFVFTYEDIAGNTGATTATVNRIDITLPTVTTGIISAGNTGQNGANIYYNGSINIKANINDAGGAGLNGATCEYTIDNGATRNPASYNITYCSLTSLTPASNINVGFRIKDNANNLTTGSTSSYLFDNIAPITTDNAPITTGKNNVTVTLSPVDTGAGISGTLYCIDTTATCTPNIAGTTANVTCAAGTLCNQYVRYYSTDKLGNTENIKTSSLIIIDKIIPTATIIYIPTSGTRTNTNITATITGFNKAITGLNATGNVFAANGSFIFNYQDLVGNTGSTTATVSRIDKTVPTVTTGIISAGSTGNNGATLYYNGTITIRADVADAGGAGLSGTTCQYTTNGSTWNTATYNTTYCSATGLTPATNITIRFRIQDTAGNTTTGNIGTYTFDNTVPTTTVLPASSTGNSDITATLTPGDTGVGILNTQYCIDTNNSCIPSTIGTTANVTGANGTIITKYLRYRSTDKVNNIETTKSIAYTIDKILPSITGTTTVSSNNATNTNYANISDVVTILFTTNKTLAALPTLTISGGSVSSASVTSLGANNYSASYTMKAADSEGQTKFMVNMLDTVGNTGTSLLTGVIFDKTNPTGLSITSPSTGHYVDGNLYTITWATGTEANFGPTSIKLEYSTTNFASSIIITTGTSNNGTYTFAFPNTLNTIGKMRLTAKDLAGNSLVITGSDFIFDTTPPTDISLTSPGLYLAGNTNYTLNRSGGTDSNPQSITVYYATDGTTYTAIPSCTKTNNEQSCTWTTPVVNSNTVTLRAIAKDKVNQTKLWTTTNFTVDSTAPTLTFTGNSNWRTSPITGSTTATDALAGISGNVLYNTIAYTTSCNSGSTTAPYYENDGIRTGYACVIDKAGNIRTGTMAYKIDQTLPILTMNTGTIRTNTGVTISLTGTDATAGVSGFQRSKISGTGTITFSSITGNTSKLTASAGGTYIIQVVLKDNANNSSTGTFTFIWDTIAPVLSGSAITINNQTASYGFTSDTTGSIEYSGSCGTGSLSTANAAANTISRTLSNATYSGCTMSIRDSAGNKSSLNIPSFTINYTAPSASAGGGGGGGGGGTYDTPTCEDIDLMCKNNIYIRKEGFTCEGGNLGKTCGSVEISSGTINKTNTASNITTSAFTYALQNKFLPSSRQKNYIGTGIVTKESLTTLLTTRSKNILKKTVKNITLYTSSGTNRMTRENVAKTIAKFARNTEYTTGNALQGLKNKGIIANISYPKNRELNDNVLTILMRLYKQQTNTGIVKPTTKPIVVLPTPVETPTSNIESGLSTGETTDSQRTPAEQKFISSMKANFQFTEGYKRGTTNTAIKYLQYFLKINNYYTGPINGSNNDATTKGLFARQTANNLITDPNDPAAGYLGPKTREVINAKLKELLQ